MTEDRADRIGHVGRFETRRRDLVEQGQEGVKVVAIDERDANALIREPAYRRQPGEAAAHDDDVGQFAQVPGGAAPRGGSLP